MDCEVSSGLVPEQKWTLEYRYLGRSRLYSISRIDTGSGVDYRVSVRLVLVQ